jgi:hypothetical protein
MHPRANGSARFFARLQLESLEGRTLPSATPLLPGPSTVQISSIETASTHHKTHHSTMQHSKVEFSTHWRMTPGTELVGTNSHTGNGWSTGGVIFSLVRDGKWSATVGKSEALPVGFVESASKGTHKHPDEFNETFLLSLTIEVGKKSAVVSFMGTIKGSLTDKKSTLKITFEQRTEKVTLGKDDFTVTLPSNLSVAAPKGLPQPIIARIKVSAATKA